jgi:hypothetical protein
MVLIHVQVYVQSEHKNAHFEFELKKNFMVSIHELRAKVIEACKENGFMGIEYMRHEIDFVSSNSGTSYVFTVHIFERRVRVRRGVLGKGK